MGSKMLMLLLISSSCFTVALCQDREAPPPCMKSLIPCKPYLHENETPPPECCVPLTQLMKTDMKCLCTIFNNPEILAGFNLTRDEAIKLPTHCDKKADLSTCDNKNGGGAPASAPGSSSSSSASASPAGGHRAGRASGSAEAPAKMDNNGADKMIVSGIGGVVGVLSLMMMMMMMI